MLEQVAWKPVPQFRPLDAHRPHQGHQFLLESTRQASTPEHFRRPLLGSCPLLPFLFTHRRMGQTLRARVRSPSRHTHTTQAPPPSPEWTLDRETGPLEPGGVGGGKGTEAGDLLRRRNTQRSIAIGPTARRSAHASDCTRSAQPWAPPPDLQVSTS